MRTCVLCTKQCDLRLESTEALTESKWEVPDSSSGPLDSSAAKSKNLKQDLRGPCVTNSTRVVLSKFINFAYSLSRGVYLGVYGFSPTR